MKPPDPIRLVVATLAAIGVAVGVALGEVWLKCQRPGSEACVWSNALLKLTLPVYVVIIGLPCGAIIYWVTGKIRRPQHRADDQHGSRRTER